MKADDARLTAYALNEMTERERYAFEQELAQSPEMRAALSAIQQTVTLLREEFAADKASSTAYVEELLAGQSIRVFARRRRWFVTGLAAAASVAFAVAWQLWFHDRRGADSSPSIHLARTEATLGSSADVFDERNRLTLRDVANVSYNSRELYTQQFLTDSGTGLTLDAGRTISWPAERGSFLFKVGYQLEF